MTDRELMQQALDALEQMAKEGWLLHGPEGMDEAQTKCIQSLEALRARLAQPEEPDWSAAGFLQTKREKNT